MIRHYFKTESTQTIAKELARQEAEPWTIIIADEMTGGYGKIHGKERAAWYAPKGGLYFSIILPKSNIDDLQTLTILAAFIVAKTIKNFQVEPFIKLPNDVYLNQKKVCGILVENIIGKEVKSSVMGIGLDTNIKKFPKELENIATSLQLELGKKVDNKLILEEIVNGLKEQLKTISE